MEIIKLIFGSIQYLLFAYMALGVLYVFFFSIMGKFYKKTSIKNTISNRKYAVFVPAYKEDGVIIEVAKHSLNQNFPKEQYDVIIIADSFEESTIVELKKLPIKVIEVVFEKSTKVKALNKAMSQLSKDYDVALILDADNLMEVDFITKIDAKFEEGFTVVQGHRVAKNMDTSFAVLDAISEEINNYIFRRSHRVIGLSSAIIGSGMAFNYAYFKNIMFSVEAVGGFDKELELKMLRENIKIEYVEDAYVYDEKVQKSEVMYNQRRRWLSAQFVYFRKYFLNATYELITKGNIDYFDKALQMLLPPRIILIGVLAIEVVLSFFVSSGPDFYQWFTLGSLFFVGMLLAVPSRFYNKQTLKAMLYIPHGFWLMVKSFLNLKGANKKFIHTPHTSTNSK